jgi:hypothetical protein
MDFLTQKKCFWPAESKSVGIFEITLSVPEIERNIFDFLTVRITVRKFFWPKNAFLDKKIHRNGTRQASFILFFPLKAEDLAFPVMIIVHC